jgi:hypothetical protein
VKEPKPYKIYSLEDWRREKLAGESWGVRMLRLTGIVWVPVVGLAAAVLIKVIAGVFIRIVIAVGTWIWRAIFH